MTVALFCTAYLPPVAYMAAMLRRHEVAIEAKETFPKQTYRNRAVIVTAGGVRTLTVPVVRSNHSTTDEVGIDYRQRWNVIHMRTLTAAYAASPYFLYYRDDLEALLMRRYDRLLDLNAALLEWILRLLKVECKVGMTTDYQLEASPSEGDYRNTFSPKQPLLSDAFAPYYQVFADRMPFVPNLSVIDLLMNMGPEAANYLLKLGNTLCLDNG